MISPSGAVLGRFLSCFSKNLFHSEQQPPVTCLIADTFFGCSSIIARKYNLVNISFWTEPALVFTLFYHLDLLIKNGHFASYGMYNLLCSRYITFDFFFIFFQTHKLALSLNLNI